jgi:hypothetical protein
MQDQGASSANKGSSAKNPPAGKPDPTSAITSSLAAVSLKLQPKFVQYNLSVQFPVLVSPTGCFRDGQMHLCVDFLGISMDFKNNYRVETSGKTLKLFMKIPWRFLDPNCVDAELVAVANDRDTIVSAQQETSGMVYCQNGNDANIWSAPQVVALPFEVEAVHFFKPIWSNGCEDLYSKLNCQSKINSGSFPNNAVHQLFLFLRVILLVVTRPAKDQTRWRINTTFLLLVVEFLLIRGQCGTAQVLFLLYFGWGQEGLQSRERIA